MIEKLLCRYQIGFLKKYSLIELEAHKFGKYR